MEKLDAISSWIKSNPLVVIAGTLTTVFAFIISTSNVIPVILKALDLPDCFTYADVYHDAWSDFKREGDKWREYPREAACIGMNSEKRTAHEIILSCSI
jgi:hypothetical protein